MTRQSFSPRTPVPLSPSVGSLSFFTCSFTGQYFPPMPWLSRCGDEPGTAQRLHPALKLRHLFLPPPCHQSTPDIPTNRLNLQDGILACQKKKKKILLVSPRFLLFLSIGNANVESLTINDLSSKASTTHVING